MRTGQFTVACGRVAGTSTVSTELHVITINLQTSVLSSPPCLSDVVRAGAQLCREGNRGVRYPSTSRAVRFWTRRGEVICMQGRLAAVQVTTSRLARYGNPSPAAPQPGLPNGFASGGTEPRDHPGPFSGEHEWRHHPDTTSGNPKPPDHFGAVDADLEPGDGFRLHSFTSFISLLQSLLWSRLSHRPEQGHRSLLFDAIFSTCGVWQIDVPQM